MKKLYLFIVVAVFAGSLYGQDGNIPATFPGGDSAWNHYLDTAFNNKNMVSQMTAKDYERFGKTQRVVYTFNILSDGSIGLINIEGQISQAVRNEVNRVLKTAPHWSPAIVGGKPSTYRKRQVSTFTFDE
jgi:hypothetical protein